MRVVIDAGTFEEVFYQRAVEEDVTDEDLQVLHLHSN
jgi:hypothetical protein